MPFIRVHRVHCLAVVKLLWLSLLCAMVSVSAQAQSKSPQVAERARLGPLLAIDPPMIVAWRGSLQDATLGQLTNQVSLGDATMARAVPILADFGTPPTAGRREGMALGVLFVRPPASLRAPNPLIELGFRSAWLRLPAVEPVAYLSTIRDRLIARGLTKKTVPASCKAAGCEYLADGSQRHVLLVPTTNDVIIIEVIAACPAETAVGEALASWYADANKAASTPAATASMAALLDTETTFAIRSTAQQIASMGERVGLIETASALRDAPPDRWIEFFAIGSAIVLEGQVTVSHAHSPSEAVTLRAVRGGGVQVIQTLNGQGVAIQDALESSPAAALPAWTGSDPVIDLRWRGNLKAASATAKNFAGFDGRSKRDIQRMMMTGGVWIYLGFALAPYSTLKLIEALDNEPAPALEAMRLIVTLEKGRPAAALALVWAKGAPADALPSSWRQSIEQLAQEWGLPAEMGPRKGQRQLIGLGLDTAAFKGREAGRPGLIATVNIKTLRTLLPIPPGAVKLDSLHWQRTREGNLLVDRFAANQLALPTPLPPHTAHTPGSAASMAADAPWRCVIDVQRAAIDTLRGFRHVAPDKRQAYLVDARRAFDKVAMCATQTPEAAADVAHIVTFISGLEALHNAADRRDVERQISVSCPQTQ